MPKRMRAGGMSEDSELDDAGPTLYRKRKKKTGLVHQRTIQRRMKAAVDKVNHPDAETSSDDEQLLNHSVDSSNDGTAYLKRYHF